MVVLHPQGQGATVKPADPSCPSISPLCKRVATGQWPVGVCVCTQVCASACTHMQLYTLVKQLWGHSAIPASLPTHVRPQGAP